MKRRPNYGLLTLILATALIGGCGIKPDKLAPPPGTEPNDFPRVYPQPETE